MPSRILVVGGAGYIGSHIAHDLCDQEYSVTVFDNLSTGLEENLHSKAEFVKGDILNENDLQKLFASQHFDVVFHFAALKAAGESMIDPGKFATHNITGTINLLNKMIEFQVPRIIFSSSSAVYGYPEYLPIDEKHPLKPINFYGFTKLEIERILKWYSELKGLRFAALRYFNAAGYDMAGRISGMERNPANLLPIVLEAAAGTRREVLVFGNDYDTPDGTGVRDYIHVNDLADAHIRAMKFLEDKQEDLILNLGTGKGFSVLEVIEAAEKIVQKSIAYRIVDRRPGDPAELEAVSNNAFRKIGWQAKYPRIEEILESMWRIYNPKN